MKQIVSNGGGGGGGRMKLPTEEEVEVVKILLSLPEIVAKSEAVKRNSINWGLTKKRSSPVLMPELSPEKFPADESPSTPLDFSPENQDMKRKGTVELVESYNRVHEERETLLKNTKGKETLLEQHTDGNLELKAMLQEASYSRSIEWNNNCATTSNQQSYLPQVTMFTPPTPQQYGKLEFFNHVNPLVNNIQKETYDFMGCSQPLDQSQYLVMESGLSVKAAQAAARKRRKLRLQENKKTLLALKQSRGSY